MGKEGKYNNPPEDLSNFGLERWMLTKMKKAVIMVLGSAAMKYMKKLSNEQELMMALSNIILPLYTAESTLLRTMKLIEQRGADKCESQVNMTKIYMHHACTVMQSNGQEAILAFTEPGKEQSTLIAGLELLLSGYYPNTKDCRRAIAATLIE